MQQDNVDSEEVKMFFFEKKAINKINKKEKKNTLNK